MRLGSRGARAPVTTGQFGYQFHRITGVLGPTPHRRPSRTAGEVKGAAGDERSELALDGDEDRATSNCGGGSQVAGGRRDPGPAAPVVSVPSDAGGDMRRDSVVKHELLHSLILPRFEVLVAVDDRAEVAQVWRDHGIFTIGVVDPDLLPTLGG